MDSFQNNRISDRLQAIVQVALVFLILIAVNYIGMRTYQRIDLTKGNIYSLSPETRAYLQQLDQPIQAIVTIPENSDDPGLSDILKDVRLLLREYEYATRNQGENRVTVEYLNIYSQTSRARALGIDDPNVIVFKTGNRQRQVRINELYKLQDSELREFLGENVFTRSILEIVESSEPVIYVTTGHGELAPNDVGQESGASALFNELKSRNFATRPIDLSTAERIPEDASMLLIASPKARFLPQEQLLLQNYLDKRAGRVLILLEPGHEHGLDDLLYNWGLLVEDALVVERDPAYIINGGDLIIRRFADHPVTSSLYNLNIRVITDRAISVREDPGRPLDDSLAVTELLITSDNSWADRQYRKPGPATFDPSIDIPGPVKIAAISEQQVDSSLGISLPGGKVTVIGTSNFVSNQRIQSSGNLYLILNAINYSIDRFTRLNIPPRPIRKVKLDLSLEQLHLVRYLIWFGPPAIVGLLGLLVYLSRRN
ncbi:GldG family protein [Pelagicoccus sp. SDUM812003]|uniref:GldG family protein n=1 Tax=Pelagicoccus sp. SDUM812003 TaxID=3041267 RepID=UPI00280CE480|nr:GldG family protein [Pelagicoccus sp. SDUM812003]MDQ8202710.1 GldG family protein [Pelagicoccus sp. SDUM812003]